MGGPNLNALKISKQYSNMANIASGDNADIVLSYKLNIY